MRRSRSGRSAPSLCPGGSRMDSQMESIWHFRHRRVGRRALTTRQKWLSGSSRLPRQPERDVSKVSEVRWRRDKSADRAGSRGYASVTETRRVKSRRRAHCCSAGARSINESSVRAIHSSRSATEIAWIPVDEEVVCLKSSLRARLVRSG